MWQELSREFPLQPFALNSLTSAAIEGIITLVVVSKFYGRPIDICIGFHGYADYCSALFNIPTATSQA